MDTASEEFILKKKIWILYGLIVILSLLFAFNDLRLFDKFANQSQDICVMKTPAYIEWRCPLAKNEAVAYAPVSCFTYRTMKEQRCNITKSQGEIYCFEECKYPEAISINGRKK